MGSEQHVRTRGSPTVQVVPAAPSSATRHDTTGQPAGVSSVTAAHQGENSRLSPTDPGAAVPNPASGTSADGEEQQQRPTTRLQHGIRKPKIYTDGSIKYGFLTAIGEPQNLEEALHDKNWNVI